MLNLQTLHNVTEQVLKQYEQQTTPFKRLNHALNTDKHQRAISVIRDINKLTKKQLGKRGSLDLSTKLTKSKSAINKPDLSQLTSELINHLEVLNQPQLLPKGNIMKLSEGAISKTLNKSVAKSGQPDTPLEAVLSQLNRAGLYLQPWQIRDLDQLEPAYLEQFAKDVRYLIDHGLGDSIKSDLTNALSGLNKTFMFPDSDDKSYYKTMDLAHKAAEAKRIIDVGFKHMTGEPDNHSINSLAGTYDAFQALHDHNDLSEDDISQVIHYPVATLLSKINHLNHSLYNSKHNSSQNKQCLDRVDKALKIDNTKDQVDVLIEQYKKLIHHYHNDPIQSANKMRYHSNRYNWRLNTDQSVDVDEDFAPETPSLSKNHNNKS